MNGINFYIHINDLVWATSIDIDSNLNKIISFISLLDATQDSNLPQRNLFLFCYPTRATEQISLDVNTRENRW